MHKDRLGKTQFHVTNCEYLGLQGLKGCGCPRRLAAGTVESIIGSLKAIFKRIGRGDSWDEARACGNPAYAQSVEEYLRVMQKEMSESRVIPRQAKPLFLSKLEKVGGFIARELEIPNLDAKERFLLLRDRAFLTLQFHAGDRAGDLCRMVAQEVKRLPEGAGFSIKRTQGKTASSAVARTCVIRSCANKAVCPVVGLEALVNGAMELGVDLRTGFLFRKIGAGQMVLELPITYDVAYDRLRLYLVTLGIYEGETPHSLRGGCAVTMRLTGAAKGVEDLQQHIGWRSSAMPMRYSRAKKAQDMSVSSRLQKAIDGESTVTAREAEELYAGEAHDGLPSAF